jgi:hypothetical protein
MEKLQYLILSNGGIGRDLYLEKQKRLVLLFSNNGDRNGDYIRVVWKPQVSAPTSAKKRSFARL